MSDVFENMITLDFNASNELEKHVEILMLENTNISCLLCLILKCGVYPLSDLLKFVIQTSHPESLIGDQKARAWPVALSGFFRKRPRSLRFAA